MDELKKLLDVAAGRVPADLVFKNCRIVDVYNAGIIQGKDVAISDGMIAGIGSYAGENEIDCQGKYLAPGFIDAHIHIESSYVTPEEIGRLIVPHGATTIIADPHEIVNVCGMDGMQYMLDASEGTELDIKFMLPSCVPSTPFENSGAVIDSEMMDKPLDNEKILGFGEFMNYPGVINADEEVMKKILVAKKHGKLIDGHSPGLSGNDLNAYIAAGIHTDHECSTVEAMNDRLSRGMYVLLREGSACHDLRTLIKGVTKENSRRCLLCSDDRQPKTILSIGHIDNHLRICAEEGIDPIIALQMASLNAAECFRLFDRGAIAPGLRADLVILDNLHYFNVQQTFIRGKEIARDGKYLPVIHRCDISPVKSSFHVKDFSVDRLKLPMRTDHVNVIGILPGGVLTKQITAIVDRDSQGNFIYNPKLDIVKVAVVERHKYTGNVSVALLGGYGIKSGAIALSIAHDSHNIIVVGTNDNDMAFAVEKLIEQDGGIMLVLDGKVLNAMPMVAGGIMSDQSGEFVCEKLAEIHRDAFEKLKVSPEVEPVMTLCFMSLPVIPEIKLTDMGLFDVKKFAFISVEADII